jgi:CheY-like chemotaxis protein
MFGKRLVVVDADVRNLRVLDRKLRDAGFEVHVASRSDEAFELAQSIHPDVVLTDLNGPNLDGIWLAKHLKSDDRTEGCGVIFLSKDASVETKQAAIEAGCDEYLNKPIFVREILLHLSNLIAKLERRDSPSSFSGSLSRLSVVDLLQLMEASRKTCIVNLSSDMERSGGFAADDTHGAIFFSQGQVVDAHVGTLRGQFAIYRMLLWRDGAFDIEFTQIDQANLVNESTQALLLEGMRRMDEWARALQSLRTPQVRLWVPPTTLDELGSAPETLLQALPLFDGRRTLLDVLDDINLKDETVVLWAIAQLVKDDKLRNFEWDGISEVDTEDVPRAIPLTHVKQRSGAEVHLAAGDESSTEDWWREMMKLV